MKHLQVKDLVFSYGRLLVLQGVSFEVEQGEVFGIAGPNGAGKTTLFNVITGFYHGKGDITFEGHRISRRAPYAVCRRGMARTFQTPALFPSLSVLENVKVGAHFGGRKESGAGKALEFVGLTERAEASPDNLNLYEKKLTMIAASLATEPRMLLLDEPAGGLSPKEVNATLELFRRINHELDITIVVIEHVMRVLTSLADRMLILSNGKEICVGSPRSVCSRQDIIDLYLGGGACNA